MTEKTIESTPLAESASNVLMQMQPGTAWYRDRLNMAIERIDELEAERRREHAARIVAESERLKLAEIARDYLADPHARARAVFEFYLDGVLKGKQ